MHLPDDLALPNLAGDSTDSAREGGFMAVVTHEFEPALTPDDIGWLAGLSALPVVVKGVQRADDAVRCVEAGAAAVVVSNHGARQLADAPATADILAEVVDAVAGRAEVYVDGGVRRAPDVVKALALGARADPGRAPVAVGAGHRRVPTAWPGCCAGTRLSCGAPWPSAARRPSTPSTAPWCAGRPGGLVPMTTVAAMLAARAEDDRTGVMDGDGRWTWREAVHEGAARGAAGPLALRRRPSPTSASCCPTAPSTSSG